jgi:2-dehydropantoate 2-reductase
MSRVCLSVPTATVSGLYLGDVFLHPETQQLFALLALELFAVAEADGCPRETVEEKTRQEWTEIKQGIKTGLERAEEFRPWPPGIVDAYTGDIRKGLPLEIDFTNGTIVTLGRQYGVPTPANEAVLSAVHAIEGGRSKAGLPLLRQLKNSLLDET